MRTLPAQTNPNNVCGAVQQSVGKVVPVDETQGVVEGHGADAVLVLDDLAVVEENGLVGEIEGGHLLAKLKLILGK